MLKLCWNGTVFSCSDPNAAGKVGVDILIAHEYVSFVTDHEALHGNKCVWIKMEGIEGRNIGIAWIYAPDILTDRRRLWHIMLDSLSMNCEWILGGNFNMTKRS